MEDNRDYIKINKSNWNERARIHVDSEFYNVKDFLTGKSSLNEIEINLLGDIRDKSILHLQCHFGMDSLSMARMGASVTGIDFSESAIEEAIKLSESLGIKVQFICSDLYDLALPEKFDIIFSSYGVIGWLPDMKKWASIIASHLKPGGKFVFVEFHPVVWMFDNHFREIEYSYFKDQAIIETESGSYAERSMEKNFQSVTWNHSLSEVLGALLDEGLIIKHFMEYDYSPYNCFLNSIDAGDGKFRISHLDNKIPMLYSLTANG